MRVYEGVVALASAGGEGDTEAIGREKDLDVYVGFVEKARPGVGDLSVREKDGLGVTFSYDKWLASGVV